MQPSLLSSSRTFLSPPERSLIPQAATPILPPPEKPLICFRSLRICRFWIFHVSVDYTTYSFLSSGFFQVLISWCFQDFNFHIVSCISTSFLFISEQYSIVWIYYILFICDDGQFGYFHISYIVNSAALIIHMQVFV